MKLRTILADDEPLARERLRLLLLAADGEIEICAECRNGKETVEALKTKQVDLLFLDIRMPGSDGFDVVREMGVAHMPATIFVTAFSEYAVTAFEVQALDYLTKPVQPERLAAALARVKQQLAQKLTSEQFLAALTSLQAAGQKDGGHPKRILVRNGTKDSFVSISEIVWIEAADYYACLHAAGRKHMLRESIKLLEETLDPAKFVRIHRSAIVNIDHVREIERDGRSEGWVVLDDGQRLRMSRVGWQKLLAASQR